MFTSVKGRLLFKHITAQHVKEKDQRFSSSDEFMKLSNTHHRQQNINARINQLTCYILYTNVYAHRVRKQHGTTRKQRENLSGTLPAHARRAHMSTSLHRVRSHLSKSQLFLETQGLTSMCHCTGLTCNVSYMTASIPWFSWSSTSKRAPKLRHTTHRKYKYKTYTSHPALEL